MQFTSTLLAAALALFSTAFAAPTTLVARSTTDCHAGPDSPGTCSETTGELYANDCSVIAGVSSLSGKGWCDAGWTDGANVECDGDGAPTVVTTSAGQFGNCYEQGGSCAIGPTVFYGIFYCCDHL
ncbi:hypothetical protein LTR15_012242 [Elasticomyces elasticus]|nr:hypothetical protein LTR15_012242 [Elasticomyces elasticus]